MNAAMKIRALWADDRLDEADAVWREEVCDLSPLRPEEEKLEPNECACGKCGPCRVALHRRGRLREG